jgi:hypothetical protein
VPAPYAASCSTEAIALNPSAAIAAATSVLPHHFSSGLSCKTSEFEADEGEARPAMLPD